MGSLISTTWHISKLVTHTQERYSDVTNSMVCPKAMPPMDRYGSRMKYGSYRPQKTIGQRTSVCRSKDSQPAHSCIYSQPNQAAWSGFSISPKPAQTRATWIGTPPGSPGVRWQGSRKGSRPARLAEFAVAGNIGWAEFAATSSKIVWKRLPSLQEPWK